MGSLDIPLGRHWTASNVAEHVRFRKLRPFFAFRSPERHLFVSFERIDLLTVHSHGQPLKQKTSADGEGPPVSSQGPGHFREAKNKTKPNKRTTKLHGPPVCCLFKHVRRFDSVTRRFLERNSAKIISVATKKKVKENTRQRTFTWSKRPTTNRLRCATKKSFKTQ